MSNGLPPSPPPSSETEIQDQARAQAQAAAPAPEPAPRSPSPVSWSEDPLDFRGTILPTLANLAAQEDFVSLVQLAERADLASEIVRLPARLLLIAPLVLAYLILDDLPPARFALTRLPENLSATPLAQTLFNLLASTWERKHAKVYSRSQDLLQLASHSDFPDAQLGTLICGMVMTFVESFRQRTFVLLAKAYTSIPLALAQTYIGLPTDDLLLAVQQRQWSFDTSNQILSPKLPSPPLLSPSLNVSTPSSLTTFHLVAESVAKLDL